MAFVGVGLLGVVIGLAIILTATDIIPVRKQLGPGVTSWIVVCAGIAFAALGGVFALTGFAQTQIGARARNRMPGLFKLLNLIVLVAAIGTLAVIASFAAFGPGPRSFTLDLPLVGRMIGAETLGRIFFGAIALVLWALVGALAWFGVKGIAAGEP